MTDEALNNLIATITEAASADLPLQVSGAPAGLFVTLAKTSDQKYVLHVINRAWSEDNLVDSTQCAAFTFCEDFHEAILRSPENDRELRLSVSKNVLEIPVRDMGMYCAVELC